jgi:hypothetical protein
VIIKRQIHSNSAAKVNMQRANTSRLSAYNSRCRAVIALDFLLTFFSPCALVVFRNQLGCSLEILLC